MHACMLLSRSGTIKKKLVGQRAFSSLVGIHKKRSVIAKMCELLRSQATARASQQRSLYYTAKASHDHELHKREVCTILQSFSRPLMMLPSARVLIICSCCRG